VARPTPESPQPPEGTFRADLRRPPKKFWRILRDVTLGLFAALAFAWGAGGLIYLTYLRGLPKIPDNARLYSINAVPGITFLDRHGQVIAVRGPKHGRKVLLNGLPPYVPRAFLAVEDHRFYEHGAVDWVGVARAARANVQAGDVVQGGSTLTQQLARTLFLKPERSLRRKVQEALLAVELEKRLTKDQVLELYLNRIFFGANAYGVDAAATTYFGKPAGALTLSEAALLAALPKAPSRLSPARDLPAALTRSRLVLRRMLEEGWITPEQLREALAHPPKLAPDSETNEDFGWVLDLAQAQALEIANDRAPDLIVRTSVDPGLQTTAALIVRRALVGEGRRAGARQAALVAFSPDGGIRALVGGADHRFSAFNRAVQAQRQPGSAFKAFVFAAAVEHGVRPLDIRTDAPVRLGRWSPENYGGGYRGPVTVQDALAKSINTVSVRLAREVGVGEVANLARRFGIRSLPDDPQGSLALGAYEVNLLELTSAYQVFQRQGLRVQPFLIEEITTSSGEPIFRRPYTAPPKVYDPFAAQQMTAMLQGVIQRGTGRAAAIGRPAAGKTGTSQRYRDAWFIGFTPDWAAGVWVGNDDGAPMNRLKGGDLPAAIWRRFMLAAHQGLPPRGFPWAINPDPVEPVASEGQDADTQAQARAGFYQTLSAEFARAEAGEE
jgi:penicillin-binding protein 1A